MMLSVCMNCMLGDIDCTCIEPRKRKISSPFQEEINKLKAENARYREALEFCAYKFVEDPAVQICHECEFGYDKIASTAYKALKGE